MNFGIKINLKSVKYNFFQNLNYRFITHQVHLLYFYIVKILLNKDLSSFRIPVGERLNQLAIDNKYKLQGKLRNYANYNYKEVKKTTLKQINLCKIQ